jgi:chromosome segregation ATPase
MEEIKREVEYLTRIVDRFDTALDNLQSLVQNIDKMAAVQNERLTTQEEQTEVIHQRIHSMKREFVDEFRLFRTEVSDRLSKLEKDVQKWKLIFSGVVASIVFFISILQIDGILGILK